LAEFSSLHESVAFSYVIWAKTFTISLVEQATQIHHAVRQCGSIVAKT